jgi:hypothetical protein
MAAPLALLISIVASAATAREHPASGALKLVVGPSAEEPPAPARQDKPSQSDDFDLLPPEKPPDADALARQAELSRALSRRRELLGLHQLAGFATLATMTATVVVGQLNYGDKYGGGGDTGKYRTAHQVLAYGTTGFFAAAGVLALLAPSPFEKPLRLDTATLHKVSMMVATAGLVAQVVLGIVTAHAEGSLSQRDFALAHQIIGYTTWAATTAGFLVLTFP